MLNSYYTVVKFYSVDFSVVPLDSVLPLYLEVGVTLCAGAFGVCPMLLRGVNAFVHI